MRDLPTVLRPYEPADLHPLAECWFETWHAAFAPRRHPRPRADWPRLFAERYAEDAETWLAMADRRVAAFLVLFPDANWIEQLFVDPRFQGRGLGRSLIALARLRCPSGLALDTPAENTPAREFYRRRGFVAQQVGYDPVIQRVTLRYAWSGRAALAAGPVRHGRHEQ